MQGKRVLTDTFILWMPVQEMKSTAIEAPMTWEPVRTQNISPAYTK
ncbi:hypothetical protein [Methanosarcina barkeri]|nr:hypothetical protein [Methanosarcina barkeri]